MNLLVDIFLFLVTCIIFPSPKRDLRANSGRNPEEMAHWIILDDLNRNNGDNVQGNSHFHNGDDPFANGEYYDGPEY